jgi:hypothetical protein
MTVEKGAFMPSQPDSITSMPAPGVFAGSGNGLVEIGDLREPVLLQISGNQDGRHFSVIGVSAEDTSVALFVSTVEPYRGIRPLGFRRLVKPAMLQVNASSDWSIRILPLSAARAITVPGSVTGVGDDVIALACAHSCQATVEGNAARKHFSIKSLGKSQKLLVNTTDPFAGTIAIPGGADYLEIRAAGDWSIEIVDQD